MIPKIIHQIWIGNQEIPEREKAFIEKCKNLHPDWEYKFWGNEEINSLFPKYEKIFLNLKAQKTPADAVDFLRIAILYEFGGIYLDCDMEINKSLNNLNLNKDIMLSISAGCFTRFQNCILGSCKNNDFFYFLLNEKSHSNNKYWGPAFLTKKYKEFYFPEKIQNIKNNNIIDFYDQIFMIGPLIQKIDCPINHEYLPTSYFFKGKIGNHHFLLSHAKENRDKYKF